MPYKRKGSPYWWVNIKGPDGTRIRQSTGTSDKAEAEAIEGRMKAELWQQTVWGKAPEYTFEEVALEYIKSRQGAKSYNMTLSSISILKHYFGGIVISSLKRDVAKQIILKMQRERNYKPGSLKQRISCLKAAIGYCRNELGWEIGNPFEGISLQAGAKHTAWLTYDEADRLIAATKSLQNGSIIAHFIMLALNTGMRKNEMLKLQWRNVNMSRRIVTLHAHENKSGRTRSVPLNDEAAAVIRERWEFVKAHCPDSKWVFAKPCGNRFVEPIHSFKRACKIAGIANFRIHDLRHTCASWLVSSGVPLADVKEVLGHSSITMTERYAHLSPHRAMDAVSKLRWSQSGHTDAQ